MCGSSFLCDRHEKSFLAPSCSNICVHWKPPEGHILLKVLIIPCIHQTVVSLACCRGRYGLQVSQLLWLTITDWSYLTVDCEQSRRDQIRFSCRQNKVLINVFVCFCWMVCHIKEQMQCWRLAFSPVWVLAQSCCLTSQQMQSLDIHRAPYQRGSSSVTPFHPGRVSGPSPAFQYSRRHTVEWFEVSSQSDVHVFGLWEEPGVPRETGTQKCWSHNQAQKLLTLPWQCWSPQSRDAFTFVMSAVWWRSDVMSE